MFFDLDQVIEYAEEKGYTFGRVVHRPPMHVFKNGASFCGIWRLGLRVIKPLLGTKKPLCMRCVRSLQKEHTDGQE